MDAMDAQVQVRGREGSQAKLMRVWYCVRRRDLTRKMPWYTSTFSFPCLSYSRPGRRNTRTLCPKHIFTDPCQWQGEKETHTGAHFSFVSYRLFLSPIVYLYRSGEHAERVTRGGESKIRRVDRDASCFTLRLMRNTFIKSM